MPVGSFAVRFSNAPYVAGCNVLVDEYVTKKDN